MKGSGGHHCTPCTCTTCKMAHMKTAYAHTKKLPLEKSLTLLDMLKRNEEESLTDPADLRDIEKD